jgi:hypothetical protein
MSAPLHALLNPAQARQFQITAIKWTVIVPEVPDLLTAMI